MDDITRSDIERYLAGDLTDAEAAAFLSSLRGDAEALAWLGRALEQQALLFDVLCAEAPEDARESRSSRRVTAVAGARRRSRLRIAAMAAACLAMAVGAAFLARNGDRSAGAARSRGAVSDAPRSRLSPPPAARRDAPSLPPGRSPDAPPPVPAPTPLAYLEYAEGLVYVISDAGRALGHAGQGILPGQGIHAAGPESRAVARFPDASRLELGADSTVTLFPEGRGVSVFLAEGVVTGELSASAAGPALILNTPHAEAGGAAARFALRCGPGETRLDVLAGRMRLKRGIDGEAIEVPEGRYAVASGEEAFAALPSAPQERPDAAAVPAAEREPAPPEAPPAAAPVPSTLTVMARLERVQGEVRVLGASGSGPVPARAGQALLSGQGVETVGDDACAAVVCLDSTRIEVGANTRASFEAMGKPVALDYGVLKVDVARQARGASVVLATPHAEAKVLGTRFVLSATPKATTVEVEEGHVRLTRRQDGAFAVVSPGQFASVRGRDPIVAHPVRVWRSFDAAMNPAGNPQAVVPDASARRPARLEFYESGADAGAGPGRRLAVFTPGRHMDDEKRDRFNHVDQYWAFAAEGYPYAGKSTAGRGEDKGERGAPPPLGVRDLQLHPPNSDRLAVAAFVAPADGLYRVSGLGARRVDERGGPVRYLVFDAARRKVAELTAAPDRAWLWEPRSFVLGALKAGDRIHFAVARQGDFGWDAAEIAWTITATE